MIPASREAKISSQMLTSRILVGGSSPPCIFHRCCSIQNFTYYGLIRHNHSPINQSFDEVLYSAEIKDRGPVSRGLAYHLVEGCRKRQDLGICRRVQVFIIRNGLHWDSHLASHLIRLFASCGNLAEANHIFSMILLPDQYAWNAIINAHVKLGPGWLPLHFYHHMEHSRKPDKITVLSILEACIDIGVIEPVRQIHELIIERELEFDNAIGSRLVDLYVKSGKLEEAQMVVNRLSSPDVIIWNRMIAAYAHQQQHFLAIQCVDDMLHACVKPDMVTFSSILNFCSSEGIMEPGKGDPKQTLHYSLERDSNISDLCISRQQELCLCRLVQALIVNYGLHSVSLLVNHLIRLFAALGSYVEAKQAFNIVLEPDHYSWNAIIDSHVKAGREDMALQLYCTMHAGLNKPDICTFLSMLKACGCIRTLEHGRYIHEHVVESGLQLNIILGNTIVDMYAKCGSLEEADKFFNRLSTRDVVSWNVMIMGYVQHNKGDAALECFQNMQHEGICPDKVTYLNLFKICSSIGSQDADVNGQIIVSYGEVRSSLEMSHSRWQDLQIGRRLQSSMLPKGLESIPILANQLIRLFAACGALNEANGAFLKVVSPDQYTWNTVIGAHSKSGATELTFDLYNKMQQAQSKPGKFTFLIMIKVCSTIGAIEQGRRLHEEILGSEIQADVVVGNSIVDMYAKCGILEEAFETFQRLPNRDMISWGVMISGYAQHGEGRLALECFKNMQHRGMKPDNFTLSSILKACGCIGAIEQGRAIYEQFVGNGLQFDIFVWSTLVDMYAKCGNLEEAREVFNRLPDRNLVSWNAMIAGYAQHGNIGSAVDCFENMQQSGIKPDDVAFVCVLTAFNRASIADEGVWYFRTMGEYHGIRTNTFHVSCMLDLLGRMGHFKAVENLLKSSIKPNISLWMSLLNACGTYGNMQLGRRCFDAIVHIDPSHTAAYVVMSNIYANAHMGENARHIEMLWEYASSQNKSVERVSEVSVWSKCHPQTDAIHAMLNTLTCTGGHFAK